MQKIFIITCLVLCLVGSAFGQGHKVDVSFTKDDKKVILKDNFKIYIVLQDSLKTTVIKPVIKNNGFVMPNFKKGQEASIIFRYQKYLVYLYRGVYLDQNVGFEFGVDYKPFDKANTEGKKLQGVKYIDYLRIHPTKKGACGVIGIGEVTHPKKYRRSILKLIK